MIVDLNLHDKIVIVIGGGNEAQKRINSLLKQNCDILVISYVYIACMCIICICVCNVCVCVCNVYVSVCVCV